VGDTFTVVSFNIHFGYEPERVIATLRSNGMAAADVLLLQEADAKSVRLLSDELHMAYVYYPAAVHPTSGSLFGVAVLSRWPIRAKRKILLPDTSYFDAARKVCMAATVEIDGVTIEVVNIHLQSGLLRTAHKRQVETVLRCAIEHVCENDPLPEPLPPPQGRIFAGDFNTWEAGLRKSLTRIMSDVPLTAIGGIAGTFSKGSDAQGSRHTMDYIFVSPRMYIRAGRVGESRTGSDHFPIEATLGLPREPR
jgi:endonuclease/exonuclease/phosphatase family metal-dependent hydrolase